MGRYEHYSYNDILLAKSEYPNKGKHIKKTIDTKKDQVIENKDYDESAAKDWLINEKVKGQVSAAINKSQYLITKEYAVTKDQMTELIQYRSKLWDTKSEIIGDDYSNFAIPDMPKWLDDKIDELKMRGIL
jgi:hypothetical protein